jgi:hypothetical protein
VVDDAGIEPGGSGGTCGICGGNCAQFEGTQIEGMVEADVEACSEFNAAAGEAGGLRGESLNGGPGYLLIGESGTDKAASELEVWAECNALGYEADAQGDSSRCSASVAEAIRTTRIDAGGQAAVDGKVVERATDDSSGVALCRRGIVVDEM